LDGLFLPKWSMESNIFLLPRKNKKEAAYRGLFVVCS